MASTSGNFPDWYRASVGYRDSWPFSQQHIITDEWFSYDAKGQISDLWQRTPHTSPQYVHSTAAYYADGTPSQITGAGLPTISFGLDGKGRIYSVTASSGRSPIASTTYNDNDQPLVVTFGSGDTETFTYDSNTNHMTKYESAVGSAVMKASGSIAGAQEY